MLLDCLSGKCILYPLGFVLMSRSILFGGRVKKKSRECNNHNLQQISDSVEKEEKYPPPPKKKKKKKKKKKCRHLPISNTKADLYINAHTKFGETPVMFTQVIIRK